jgi:LysR family transcriptional regulator, glycine cleavage system transcriptional activator
MLRAPSTTALLCFETSARLGSFTRAGKELHLTQGAVSRQVIGLEQRLGVALFIRKSHASVLALTDAGRTYLAEIAPLLQRLERATADVMAHQGRGGALTVSVGASFGSYWLMPRLSEFTRLHPEIVLNVATRLGQADFGSARIDASIEFGDGKRPSMDCHFVLPLRMQAYAAPSWIKSNGNQITHLTPPIALIQHSTVPEAWPGWMVQAGQGAHQIAQGPRYDLMSMALNAVIGGLGAALLPPFMVTEALATKRLRKVGKATWVSTRGYHLVHPSASRDSRALTTFRQWLLSAAHDSDHIGL